MGRESLKSQVFSPGLIQQESQTTRIPKEGAGELAWGVGLGCLGESCFRTWYREGAREQVSEYSMNRPPSLPQREKKGWPEVRGGERSRDVDITLSWRKKLAGRDVTGSQRRWAEQMQMGGCIVYTSKKYSGLQGCHTGRDRKAVRRYAR